MKPIPVSFHIGPLLVHTYGVGLAVTFWFGYRYFERRLRARGYPTDWVTGMFLWVVVTAVVGARAMHVLANVSYYSSHPGEILSIWHGGLSSFGGLLFAVPTGLLLARRRCRELPTVVALDVVAPVLMAAWGIGRLLGPQLMVAGGGARTTAWYGMYYAGEAGRRVPVPIFQAVDSFAIFAVLILIERTVARRPRGFVVAAAAGLWGLARFLEEHFWLGSHAQVGSTQSESGAGPLLVQSAGLLLLVAGAATMAWLWRRGRFDTDEEPQDAGASAGDTVEDEDRDEAEDPTEDGGASESAPPGPVVTPETAR